MPLILQPSIDSLDRAELEAHIADKRARRMVAAIEYNQGVNAKLSHQQDKIGRKLKAQYEMLLKEMEQFDKAADKVDKRLVTIDSLKSEIGLVTSMIVIANKDATDE